MDEEIDKPTNKKIQNNKKSKIEQIDEEMDELEKEIEMEEKWNKSGSKIVGNEKNKKIEISMDSQTQI